MNQIIGGAWHAYVSRMRDESPIIHFVKTGDGHALCGKGRPWYPRPTGTLSGPVDQAGREKCNKCIEIMKSIAAKRKLTAKAFVKLLDKMEPAVAQQIGQVWPAHAREDDTADWWETSGPAIIQDMKNQLRRNT